MTEKGERLDWRQILGGPLKIEYHQEVDILTLWSGKPASNGYHIAKDLVVQHPSNEG